MVLEREGYTPELTSKSRTELQKFSKWFHANQGGNWPTVIGGWAVWSYHPDGLGSRDADLIFPTDNWIENMMKKTYFPGNGFQEYKIGDPIFGESHYGKPIGAGDIVFFDLISAEIPRVDSVNMGVIVDWNWVYESEQTEPIGNNASINVPELEFLISLKIIGCISRRRKLQLTFDKSYFLSKIWKDCHDVANLTNHLNPSSEKLYKNFTRTNIDKKLIHEFLEICDGQKTALDEGNSTMKPLEALLGLFKK